MPTRRGPVRTLTHLAVVALAVAGMSVTPPATADTAPAPGVPATVTADSLPTVQIDGVVWQQAIAGSRAFAGGDFAHARPAGARAGTSTVPRANLLAYDLATGELDTSWAPQPNAQVRAVVASPDGSRVYVGGSFTSIAGQARYRIAAFDTASGELLSSFAPGFDGQVRAIAVSGTTVYVGGAFTSANGETRRRLAAFDAATGALLPWAPSADNGSVSALTVSPDGTQVVVGGSFTTFGGSGAPGYGLARVDGVTGASLPLPMNQVIRNAGSAASITSLTSDEDSFYATGYVFGSTGNLEGAARGSWGTGELVWVEDCHGDTYAAWPGGDVVYVAGHPHYCGNIGGFPQTEPWSYHRALAFTKEATGTVGRDPHGYFNFEGNPAPTLLSWYPDLNTGTYTGQGQGPWAVTGNDDYVLYGGEFTIVNNKGQQGLARFARTGIAPNTQGPRLGSDTWPLDVVSYQAGSARLSWGANYDRDNEELTYTITRNGQVVHTTTGRSVVWDRPTMRWIDTGLTPGETYTYRIRATDPFGNTAITPQVQVTVADTAISEYAQSVLDDGATSYWRLGEPTGSTAHDWSGSADLTLGTGVTRGASGAVVGDDDAATTFRGTAQGTGATATSAPAPGTFSVEAWVRTTSTRGGKIIGYASHATGTSSSYDRHVYMSDDGRITFGVYPGSARTVTGPDAYNDGAWHHVVATLGPDGMRLHVDGRRVAQRADTTSAQSYTGRWRIGGDNLDGWPGRPTSRNLAGDIDDVAVYAAPLTAGQVAAHWTASGRTLDAPPAPTDPYGAAVHEADPDLYWRLSDKGVLAADAGRAGLTGLYRGSLARGLDGAVAGTTDTAVRGAGTVGAFVVSSRPLTNPTTYSQELWFRTGTTQGGKLIGFGDRDTGTSTSYDRHVYMEEDGRLTFGVWSGAATTVTSERAYNDDGWHHLVATQGAGGMRLYVDGELVGSDPQRGAQDYTGYWRVFGDTTWGPQPWFAGMIDEVAVYPTVLTPETVALHHALGTTGAPPQQPPVAAFSVAATDLSVRLDGSASTDPDGSVTAWTWDLGDGTTGEGTTFEHTYAEAGTYPVTLTVTDDAGAQATVTQDVTITAPAPNAPPVAAFTATTDGLTVRVDGSTSSDVDGSVATWAWDLGDGTTAQGASFEHTYATSGTFAVTLTVTDDDGATAGLSQDVTVSAPASDAPTAADGFGRTVSGGWGAADIGGGWSVVGGAVNFAVADGVATARAPRGGYRLESFLPVEAASTDVTVSVGLDVPPTGSGTDLEVAARTVGPHDGYRARLKMLPTGGVRASLLATSARATTVLTQVNVPGLTYVAGETLNVRVQATGSSPTTLRAKVWHAGTEEPAAWTLAAVHADPALQVPGGVALAAYTSGSTRTLPLTARWSDLVVRPVVP